MYTLRKPTFFFATTLFRDLSKINCGNLLSQQSLIHNRVVITTTQLTFVYSDNYLR